MDYRRQIFKLDDSELEISLDRIESLYQIGRIQKTDNVYICDSPGASFLPYKLEFLQNLYGYEYPFRRIINLNPNANRIDDFSSSGSSDDDDEREKEEPIEERTKKKSVRLNDENTTVVMFEPDSPATQKYTILPLFQKSNGADDLMFGDDLNNAYVELRRMAPLPWENKSEILEYFKDLKKTADNLVKCELCNFTPFNPQLVIQHLFNDEHRKQLAKHGASKKSFKYWQNRFLEVNPMLALAKQRASSFKSRVPLIFDPKDTSLGKRNNFRSGKKLIDLIAKIDETALNKHGEFFNLFFEEIGYPICCPMCDDNTKFARFPSSIVNHLISDSHLKKLKQYGYYEVDYSFWCQILHQFRDKIMKKESSVSKTATTKTVVPKKQSANNKIISNAVAEQKGLAIQKARIWKNRIPLIFDPNDKTLGKRKSWKNGNALRKCIEKIDEKKVNEKDGFFDAFFEAIQIPSCCSLCNQNLSTEPYWILTHLVSDSHYNKLKEHGFYENEYSFWCQIMNDLKKEVKKPTPKSTSFIVPLLGKSEDIDDFVDIKKRESLLKRLENGLNNVDRMGLNGSEKMKMALKKARSMECGFECGSSSVIPMVPSTILQHCLKPPHRQALLSHGFVSEDFEFWMNELGIHKAMKLKESLKKNVPRIPLIDIGDTRGTAVSKRGEIVNKLNRMWESVTAKNFNKAAASLMLYNKQGTCHACQLPAACFSNPVSIATHVFSPEHKQHMIKHGFREADVRLWTKLLNDAMNNRVTPPPSAPPVATVAPQKKENIVMPTVRQQTVPKVEPKIQQNPVKGVQNQPVKNVVPKKQQKRVPLLDKPLETHTLITDENEIDEIWNQMKIIIRNPIKRTCYVTIMGKDRYYCTTCYQNFEDGYYMPFSGRLVHHVFSHQHLKNLKPYGISKEDLNHWKQLFDETLVTKQYTNIAIPFLYANIDNRDAMKFRKLSKNVVMKKFEELREKVEHFNAGEFDEIFRPLVFRHDRNNCIWCDFPFHKSSSTLAKHVVDEKHVENVLKFCLVSEDDFREWFDKFKFIEWVREEKRLEVESEKKNKLKTNPPDNVQLVLDTINMIAVEGPKIMEAIRTITTETTKIMGLESEKPKAIVAKPVPVVKTAVVQPTTISSAPKPTIQRQRIPLIHKSDYSGYSWPSISRLSRIRALQKPIVVIFMDKTTCDYCQCSVTSFNLINHVYSVAHMYNVYLKRYCFPPSDHAFYDKWLGSDSDRSSVTFPPHWFEPSCSYNRYVANEEHISLLRTMDREKMDTDGSQLTRSYLQPTGCPTCSVWLLTPSEVAEHLIGYNHNSKHFMKKDIMAIIIRAIQQCQKPKTQEGLCILM